MKYQVVFLFIIIVGGCTKGTDNKGYEYEMSRNVKLEYLDSITLKSELSGTGAYNPDSVMVEKLSFPRRSPTLLWPGNTQEDQPFINYNYWSSLSTLANASMRVNGVYDTIVFRLSSLQTDTLIIVKPASQDSVTFTLNGKKITTAYADDPVSPTLTFYR